MEDSPTPAPPRSWRDRVQERGDGTQVATPGSGGSQPMAEARSSAQPSTQPAAHAVVATPTSNDEQEQGYGGGNDRNLPKFTGESAQEYDEYVRMIGFWVQSCRLKPSQQAGRLIFGLSGKALEATKHLKARDLALAEPYDDEKDPEEGNSGIDKLLRCFLGTRDQPVQRLEKVADKFFELARHHNESYEEYLTRADQVRRELKHEDVSFAVGEGFWCLFILRTMGLTPFQRSQMLTMTNGAYTEKEIYRVIRALGPIWEKEARLQRGVGGHPGSAPRPAFRRSHGAHAAELEKPAGPSPGTPVPGGLGEPPGLGIDDEDEIREMEALAGSLDAEIPASGACPEDIELEQMEIEALQAVVTAKQRAADVRKARGYFRGGEPGKKYTGIDKDRLKKDFTELKEEHQMSSLWPVRPLAPRRRLQHEGQA